MSLVEFFKSLALDTWYKALVYIGGVVLVLSLFLEVKGISNYQLQLLSAGVFYFQGGIADRLSSDTAERSTITYHLFCPAHICRRRRIYDYRANCI